ncbi:MAG: helix-turn-helix domain-containing protein [Longicatena caecimuris]|uniref:helix-turn-helix domain-containing protein n=1 Tax=Longicatena caecimuris TaxID=1796635 RepID=UPI0039916413
MPETTPLIKAALNLRVGVGFDVYDQTEVYWVHFTGSDVTNILRSYGLTDDKKVFYCGSDPSYQNLFRAMINELQMCKDSYQEMLEMYLRQIFIKLQRYFNNSIRIDNSRTAETIDMAIAYFNEHYSESISIEEYAEKNHVSTSWFIRNFKLYVGSTPMQFILQKRICNAEALLLNTEYNINEIAQIVGYDNALYFSRMFKKIKGISPSEYRKNI